MRFKGKSYISTNKFFREMNNFCVKKNANKQITNASYAVFLDRVYNMGIINTHAFFALVAKFTHCYRYPHSYTVIFEGHKICRFHCKLAEHKILILTKKQWLMEQYIQLDDQ